jgi:putative DNA primase/helicase
MSVDADEIRADFAKFRGCNVSIVTGEVSGIFVVECDTEAGHNVNGAANLTEWERVYGALPDTLMAESPTGSVHRYFKHPGKKVWNSSNTIAPGVDCMGDGGMVVAPPSVRPDKPGKPGGTYRWLNEGHDIAEAPQALLDVVCSPKKTKPSEAPDNDGDDDNQWNDFNSKYGQSRGTGNGRWREFNTAMLHNLSAWFPALFPGGAKPYQNGYTVSSAWLKRPLQERISALPIGIYDFGIRRGYTPIDLVIEYHYTDFSGAVAWLTEKTGIKVEEDTPGQRKSGDPETEAEAPLFSEIDLANTFVDQHESNLRFVFKWGTWMIWDGTRWAFDETMRAFDLSRLVCREAAKRCNKSSEAKALASAKTVAAVERLAKAYRTLAATVEEWDAAPLLFNDTSATIDLQTGYARTPDRINYMTQKAGCQAAPVGTPHPLWTSFLNRITGNDPELSKFLQRYIGYCLTGETTEHVFVFAYGTGANGKGVFLNTIAKVFGEYAVVADMATFIDSKNDRHPTEIAKLRGSRMVVAQETQQGRSWDEAKIKSITGGDKQTARFMRQDFFDFFPTFKLFIVGNHKPRLKVVDEAMRRRLLLVPFTVQIPVAERDVNLSTKLEAEWPAILRWAIDGGLEWQRIGLAPPKAVTDATAEYFAAEDAFGQWLEDECDVKVGEMKLWDRTGDLFDAWSKHAGKAGIEPGNKKGFNELMTSRGFVAERKEVDGKTTRCFRGVRLKLTAEDRGD